MKTGKVISLPFFPQDPGSHFEIFLSELIVFYGQLGISILLLTVFFFRHSRAQKIDDEISSQIYETNTSQTQLLMESSRPSINL